MEQNPAFRLLCNTLKKCRVQVLTIDPNLSADSRTDLGLRQIIGKSMLYGHTLKQRLGEIKEKTIYKSTDFYCCDYVYLLLPNTKPSKLLYIGPFQSTAPSDRELLERCERFGMSLESVDALRNYYSNLPVLPEESHLFVMLYSFAETVFETEDFDVVTLNVGAELDFSSAFSPSKPKTAPVNSEWNMRVMEERYRYENEIMQAVSRGNIDKVNRLLSNITIFSFERRLDDPLRNLKNYCIVMNTLLRKAAEQGGVHPIYLDKMSSEFARKIEQIPSVAAAQRNIQKYFKSYCMLVRNHSMKSYSSPVRSAVITIDADLSADLSLSALAKQQNISAGYLSTVFKKETGETLTEYVNRRRVQQAERLLKTTNLQIQTIAQHCGILDVHYFSKIFKKRTGLSPKEFRETLSKGE